MRRSAETIAVICREATKMHDGLPLRMQGTVYAYVRFHERLGNIPTDLADNLLYSFAFLDAQESIAADPQCAAIERRQEELAAKYGMFNEHDCVLRLGYEQVPGMDELIREWMFRMDELVAQHLSAWGEKELAMRSQVDSDSFNIHVVMRAYGIDPHELKPEVLAAA